MSMRFPLLVVTALVVAGSPAFAVPDAKVKTTVSKAVRTAPGVVVRKTLPNNLEFNALGIITPALTEDVSLSKLGQASVISRTGPQRTQSYVGGFTFTPSGHVTDDKAFRIGLSSRMQGVSDTSGPSLSAAAPANYAVGFALGYRGFALEGGYNRVARATRSLAEGVDVGLSYGRADWRTSVKVSQAEVSRDPYNVASLFSPELHRAVELGGAYQIARGVSLTGGLRYQLAYPLDGKRNTKAQPDAGAVFLGTSVDF